MNSLSQRHNFPQARLLIFISGKPVLQGKFFWLNEKPVFLVNIDDNKLFRNYNGYSIATQILETFEKAKIRPLILYKHIHKNLIYQTTPSMFKKKGISVDYGGHRQFVLPINHWKFFNDDLNELYNLPSVSVDNWLKPPKIYSKPVSQDEYINQRLKLRDLFLKATKENIS